MAFLRCVWSRTPATSATLSASRLRAHEVPAGATATTYSSDATLSRRSCAASGAVSWTTE
jgi:hypothetical protein